LSGRKISTNLHDNAGTDAGGRLVYRPNSERYNAQAAIYSLFICV